LYDIEFAIFESACSVSLSVASERTGDYSAVWTFYVA